MVRSRGPKPAVPVAVAVPKVEGQAKEEEEMWGQPLETPVPLSPEEAARRKRFEAYILAAVALYLPVLFTCRVREGPARAGRSGLCSPCRAVVAGDVLDAVAPAAALRLLRRAALAAPQGGQGRRPPGNAPPGWVHTSHRTHAWAIA